MKLFSGRSKPSTDTSVMKIVDTYINDSSSSNYREWVLAISNSKLYIAMQMGTICTPLNRIDPSTWTDGERSLAPVRIDPTNLYPEYKPTYHRFRWRKGEDHTTVFKKYRDPLKLAAQLGSLDDLRHNIIARVTDREIHTCELLRDNPCKNIAKYRGVQCKDVLKLGHAGASMRLDTERIMKLVFKRYDCDLHELVKNQQHIDIKYCLQSIADGIAHMHSLQMVHSDIKPANIFVEVNSSRSASHSHEFVLGDFDSATITGTNSELKSGTKHWARQKEHGVVEEEDDWYSFRMLKAWLVRANGGNLEDFNGIGK
jgi:hypothetical protein